MKKSRFSEERIVGVLKEAEAGVPVKELCRRIGISTPTSYYWKAKYGGQEVNGARRLRRLEEGNRRPLGKITLLCGSRQRAPGQHPPVPSTNEVARTCSHAGILKD